MVLCRNYRFLRTVTPHCFLKDGVNVPCSQVSLFRAGHVRDVLPADSDDFSDGTLVPGLLSGGMASFESSFSIGFLVDGAALPG